MTSVENDNILLTDKVSKIFLNYVIPSTIGTLMNSLYILFDTLYIGQRIGELGLAALNIVIPIFHILYALGLLIGTGGAAIMAISIGENKRDEANTAYNYSIKIGVGLSIITTLLGLIFFDDIINLLGATEANRPYVYDYLKIMIPCSWSFILVYNLAPLVRNDGAPKKAMIAMGVGSILNIVLDYIFIYPMDMGMAGGALGTVISSMVSLSILSHHLIKKKKSDFKLEKVKFEFKKIQRLIKVGTTSFVTEMSIALIVFLFNMELIRTLGDIGVSAYGIITNISLMATSIFGGLSQGIQPILGVNYGARKEERVKEILKIALIIGVGIGMFFLLISQFFPQQLIRIFTSETGRIVDITEYGLRIYFLAVPMMGANIVLASYYQSIELTRLSTAISMSRGLVSIFISLEVLSRLLGATGIWMATPVAELVTLIIGILGAYLVKEKSALPEY